MTQEPKEVAPKKPADEAGRVETAIMEPTSRRQRWMRRIKLFVYYCAPCFLALAVALGTNFLRVREVAKVVETQACQQLLVPNVVPESVPPNLQEIVKVVKSNGYANCDQKSSLTDTALIGRQYIRDKFFTGWLSNALFISTLSILPFGILGAGLALKYDPQKQINLHSLAKGNERSETLDNSSLFFQVSKKDEYRYYRTIAHRAFLLKYLVGFIIAMGWLYTFYPMGQAASSINDWLSNANILSKVTAPTFFKLKDSPITHAIAAVFGWYLYLLGYFFYRFYKSDVLSTKIYNVLFKKFLFVIGVALIISSVGEASKESLLLIFLIAIFPLSAVTLLAEFGNKRLSMGEEQTSLSILPGISTWQILRLEEEGADSVSSLAISDPAALGQVISREMISPEVLETWIDKARLITVIGPKRWTDINGICETASEFIKKQSANDSGFIAKLGEKSIFNADEISRTLQKTFNLKP